MTTMREQMLDGELSQADGAALGPRRDNRAAA